jgi:hypothetical protein
MKKVITFVIIIFIILSFTSVFAMDAKEIEETDTTSNLIEEQQRVRTRLDESIERYHGNETYGTVAFVLATIRYYSIPVCFLGIAVRSNFAIYFRYKKIRL